MAKNKFDSAPDLPVSLRFSTANTLLSVLLQQKQHAKVAAAEGYPTLLEEIDSLDPLIEGLAKYVDSNT